MTTLLATGILILFGVLDANATPIRPDIQKLLEQPPDDATQFAPARAGWHGSELAKSADAGINPAMQRFSAEASAHVLRATLAAAAIPDWRAVGAILLIIVVLRKTRKRATPQPTSTSEYERPAEMRPAA